MTEIYVIRHAQSEGNLFRMMQGHWDGNVTAMGLLQIDALAERMKDVHIDALYSSDLRRARLTAGAIVKHHDVELRTDRALREMDLGPWEGRFFGDLKREEYASMLRFVTDMGSWRLDGAENCPQTAERMFAALVRIAEENDGRTVAVVSHGVSIRCLLSRCLGIPLTDTENLPIATNTGITRLFYENGVFTADTVNDAAHLAGIDTPIWGHTPDLAGVPFDPADDPAWYTDCYRRSWLAAHGNLNGFDPAACLFAAQERYAADNRAVLKMLDGEESVGLMDMDVRRGEDEGYGWISLLYLREDYRHKGCGIQLLARAISLYTKLGRGAIRLTVAEENTAAVKFYQRWGFTELKKENTGRGRLLLMEKKLGVSRDA